MTYKIQYAPESTVKPDATPEDWDRLRVKNEQVGGNHYTIMKIQPVDYILENDLGFLEGNIIKYVSRYKNKAGKVDLEKAKHCLELLIKKVYG